MRASIVVHLDDEDAIVAIAAEQIGFRQPFLQQSLQIGCQSRVQVARYVVAAFELIEQRLRLWREQPPKRVFRWSVHRMQPSSGQYGAAKLFGREQRTLAVRRWWNTQEPYPSDRAPWILNQALSGSGKAQDQRS